MAQLDWLVGTVTVVFERQRAHSAYAVAQALLEVDEVATVLTQATGSQTIFRVNLQGLTPEEAAAAALRPAEHVCETLALTCEVLSVVVEREDDAVPFTGRTVVFSRDLRLGIVP